MITAVRLRFFDGRSVSISGLRFYDAIDGTPLEGEPFQVGTGTAVNAFSENINELWESEWSGGSLAIGLTLAAPVEHIAKIEIRTNRSWTWLDGISAFAAEALIDDEWVTIFRETKNGDWVTTEYTPFNPVKSQVAPSPNASRHWRMTMRQMSQSNFQFSRLWMFDSDGVDLINSATLTYHTGNGYVHPTPRDYLRMQTGAGETVTFETRQSEYCYLDISFPYAVDITSYAIRGGDHWWTDDYTTKQWTISRHNGAAWELLSVIDGSIMWQTNRERRDFAIDYTAYRIRLGDNSGNGYSLTEVDIRNEAGSILPSRPIGRSSILAHSYRRPSDIFNALDGNTSTSAVFHSNSTRPDGEQFITILVADDTADRIVIDPSATNQAPKSFSVEITTDSGVTWQPLASFTSIVWSDHEPKTFSFQEANPAVHVSAMGGYVVTGTTGAGVTRMGGYVVTGTTGAGVTRMGGYVVTGTTGAGVSRMGGYVVTGPDWGDDEEETPVITAKRRRQSLHG